MVTRLVTSFATSAEISAEMSFGRGLAASRARVLGLVLGLVLCAGLCAVLCAGWWGSEFWAVSVWAGLRAAAGRVFPRLRWSSPGVADRLVTAYPRVIHSLHPGVWGKEPWGRTQRISRELPPREARPCARQDRRVKGSTGAPPQIVHSLGPPNPQPVLRVHPNFSTGLSSSLGGSREWAFCPQVSKSSGSMKSSRWIPGGPSRSL